MGARFQDQVAVISGGGRGIGRAVALAFAEEGATCVLAGRRLDALETCAAEVRRSGGKAVVDYQASAFLLVEGRIDGVKLRGWADKFAKGNPQLLKIHPAGKSQIYQLEAGRTFYAAQLGPTLWAVSLTREPIAEALERAGGKVKSVVKYKEVVAAIGVALTAGIRSR